MSLLNKKRDKGVGVSTDTLSHPELTFLLKVLHDCNFEGKDVFLLADVVSKLQNQLKSK